MKERFIFAGALCVVVGIAVGVGGTALYYRRSATTFATRVNCKAIAEKYVAQPDLFGSSPSLNEVEFSRSRNSCIAATVSFSKGISVYEVVDVVSNEKLFSRDSALSELQRDTQIRDEWDKAYRAAIGR